MGTSGNLTLGGEHKMPSGDTPLPPLLSPFAWRPWRPTGRAPAAPSLGTESLEKMEPTVHLSLPTGSLVVKGVLQRPFVWLALLKIHGCTKNSNYTQKPGDSCTKKQNYGGDDWLGISYLFECCLPVFPDPGNLRPTKIRKGSERL